MVCAVLGYFLCLVTGVLFYRILYWMAFSLWAGQLLDRGARVAGVWSRGKGCVPEVQAFF
jgi:hypothetical protein